MKILLMLLLLVSLTFSQSDWTVVMEPQIPEVGSMDNYFFLDANEGWLVGRPTSSASPVILHTVDAGATWEVQLSLPAGADTAWQAVAFYDSNSGWVIANDGIIWQTIDGGVTWTDVTPGLTTKTLRALCVVDANTVYVCGSDGVVLKTVDGGTTWTDISLTTWGSSDVYGIYAYDALKLYAVSGSNDGMYAYSVDGGATWTDAYLPFPPSGTSQRSYNCTGKADGTAYVSSYHGTVFKSTDFGQTFSVVANIYPTLYKIFYSVATFNDMVWAGGSDGKLFKSSDAGATWDTLSYPTINTIYSIKAFDENNVYFFSKYAQTFKSTDGGATMSPMFSWPNVTWYDMQAVNANKIAAVSLTGGEITISNDGGLTWTYPTKPTPEAFGNLMYVNFYDENLGFCSGRSGQVMKTTDGGVTWALKPNPQQYYSSTKAMYFVQYADINTWFAGGNSGYLETSTDGGETWTESDLGSSTLYDCAFFNATTGAIVASSNKFYQTTDGGATWNEVADLGSNTVRSISVLNATTAVASAAKGYVYKTTDAGATWTEVTQLVNANAPTDEPDLYRVEFADATTGYICGEDGAIYKSTDAGDTWTQMASIPGLESYTNEALGVIDANRAFMASQNGYIMGTGISGIEINANVATDFQLHQNYPNPFNPTTTIKFDVPVASDVKLVIYNSLGQVVKTLVSENVSAGGHEIVWNGVNDFGLHSPSGIYFYQLTAGDFQQVNKMILMK